MNYMDKIFKEGKVHTYNILKKMCDVVDAPISVVNSSDDWYNKYTWTKIQQDDFRDYLTQYLYDNSKARSEIMSYPRKNKKNCKEVADWFVFGYGWKLKD